MGKHRKPSQTKTEIVFDKSLRKEFLTGFSKRKKERQAKAKQELEDQIKAEKQKVKNEIRNARNMKLHNDVVQSKLSEIRKLENLETKKSKFVEDDGREVETEEIDMTGNLLGVVADSGKVEAEDVDKSEVANGSDKTGAADEITLKDIDHEITQTEAKKEEDSSNPNAFSRTKQKKIQGKEGQLKKLENVVNKGKISAAKNKKNLAQRKHNKTLSKKGKLGFKRTGKKKY